MKANSPEFDGAAVEGQIERIRTSLKRVKNIKTKLTVIGQSAIMIEEEATGLHDEIREALNAIDDAIRPATSTNP